MFECNCLYFSGEFQHHHYAKLVNASKSSGGDVDVRVNINIDTANKTTEAENHFRPNKEVLEKILKSPTSKEHVTAVKILKALMNKLKGKQKEELERNNKEGNTSKESDDITAKDEINSLDVAGEKTLQETVVNQIPKKKNHDSQLADHNPFSHETRQEKTSKMKQSTLKSKPGDGHVMKTEKIRHILKKLQQAQKLRKKHQKKRKAKQSKIKDKKIKKLEKVNRTESLNQTLNRKQNDPLTEMYTKKINETKQAFTEALKQALKETTATALLRLHQNLTSVIKNNKLDENKTEEISKSSNDKNLINLGHDSTNNASTNNSTSSLQNIPNLEKYNNKPAKERPNKTVDYEPNQEGPHDHIAEANTEDEKKLHTDNALDNNETTNVDKNKNKNNVQSIEENQKTETKLGRPFVETSSSFDTDKDSGIVATENKLKDAQNYGEIGDKTFDIEKGISSTFKEISGANSSLPVVPKISTQVPDNQRKIVTNIYKIIIHKNDSKMIQQEPNDILGETRDMSAMSFAKNITDNKGSSGSGTNDEENLMETDEMDADDDTEIDYQNANVNRNKPSTMTGKTLTITFQENALKLGGSATDNKEQILPGTAHMRKEKRPVDKKNLYEHTNQVGKYADEETKKPFQISEIPEMQSKQYRIYEDNSKNDPTERQQKQYKSNDDKSEAEASESQEKQSKSNENDSAKSDGFNFTDGLLHDYGTSRPQKLFNDSLFELAGLKASDENVQPKQTNETQKTDVNENKDDNAKTKSTMGGEEESEGSNDTAIGNDEYDEEAIDSSGASGSSNIGEELFFSKNERLSDDVLKSSDNFGKYMQDKRDIIAASFKNFASNILNHRPLRFLFMRNKNPQSKGAVNDRQKNEKKYTISNISLKLEEPKFEKAVKKSGNESFHLHFENETIEPPVKRNELLLQKRDSTKIKNDSLYDKVVNRDLYGSLIFKRNIKRNIVSEDDADETDEEELNNDRYHKEIIMLNDRPLIKDTPDKIFEKTVSQNKPYRKRNEIPTRERIVAKRSALKSKNSLKKPKTPAESLKTAQKKTEKKSLDEEVGSKRIEIPFGVPSEISSHFSPPAGDLDSLYNFGTDANVQSRPVFGSDSDVYTQSLLTHSKPIGVQKDAVSILDPPVITGDSATANDAATNSFSPEDETEAKQALMNYKNSILDNDGQDYNKIAETETVSNRVNLDKEALKGIAGDTAPMRPADTGPFPSTGFQQMINFKGDRRPMYDSTMYVGSQMHPLDNSVIASDNEQQVPNVKGMGIALHGSLLTQQGTGMTPIAPDVIQDTLKAKDQSEKEQDEIASEDTALAEKQLHEMDIQRAKLELKTRAQQTGMQGAIRSSDSIHNLTKLLVAKGNSTLQLPKQSHKDKDSQASFAKPKVATKAKEKLAKKLSEPIKLVTTIKKIKSPSKLFFSGLKFGGLSPLMKDYFIKKDKRKKMKELTLKEIQDAELEVSKRSQKPRLKRHEVGNDENENEKAITSEADIPGVFAEKTDRKINREFLGDSIDTNSITDDVRKRTPKNSYSDVIIDEGLDTSKRHSVKKNSKNTNKKTILDKKKSDLVKRDENFLATGQGKLVLLLVLFNFQVHTFLSLETCETLWYCSFFSCQVFQNSVFKEKITKHFFVKGNFSEASSFMVILEFSVVTR